MHNVIVCLRVMLSVKKGPSAIERGFLRHDPTKGVELPARHPEQIVPPTREQVWALIDVATELGGPGRDMVYLVAFTELRRHEVLALEFRDVDWSNREIRISRDGVRSRTALFMVYEAQASVGKRF